MMHIILIIISILKLTTSSKDEKTSGQFDS